VKHYDLYPGLFLMAVSIGGCILASRLGLGTLHSPGAGLIPFGTAAILALMSAGMVAGSLIRAAKEKEIPAAKLFAGINWTAAILVLCTLAGYGAAFDRLGFDICNFLMMVVLLLAVCHKRLWLTLAVSVATAVGAHLLFITWLNCQFPRGLLGL
jgi:hypothetical protein